MTLKELVEARQSDRKYDPSRTIEREVIERILECARLAPSGTNSQPWHFVVVDEPELRDKVASAVSSTLLGGMNKFAYSAPVLIVMVEEPANVEGKAGSILLRRHLPAYDLGIAASYITLAATEEGLGSCIMGWLNQRKLRNILGVPKRKNIPLVIALGYSLQEKRDKKRKPIEEIRSYNSYKE
ncbi:nitroreductase family protein [Porphyromonas levii]|uniref:nitroreductase family protein n=1 Tax=Porphyromonas levii TaxID=28114 RepID=UPI001B8D76D0|nr:putative NAD(P)H nitroreductase [Porphyromonas levii]MBR8714739.1 putative NAD(P)H nitroreductase [Porphyromonas levii]MBR8727223.1 putative NAD(P)H nitroreductase [Porphyromonas levii]MBR8735362.1 putative NAD(P)H nitroreductase [Porphyromonas levii]MBR8772931.1 putative NAD(P)H nitroreductase [Porphyromonas levii]